MKRKFATNLVLLLALNLVVKPFWIFGIDRTVQNVVGPSEYGIFFALFNFSILLNILLDFGITNFNNREISRHAQLLPRYFSNLFVIKFFFAFIYMIVCFSMALFLGYGGKHLWLLAFLSLNQFISSLILYFRSNLSGLQLFKTDSLVSVTDRVLMIGLCSFLLWGPLKYSFKIEWFVYSQTIAYSITALIAFLIVFSKAEFFRPRFDRSFLVVIFKQSYPFALLVLLMSFYYRIDTVMLERILPNGDVESGIYAQAFRLLDAANMVPFLFASLLLPIFSRMLKTNEPIGPLLGFAFNILMVLSFTFALVCIIYRDPIMDLLYIHHPKESSAVLAILMVCFIFISSSYIFGTLLTANGNLRYLNFTSFAGVLVNISFNIILIPKYHAIGAAIASMLTQLTMASLQLLIVYKLFRFSSKDSKLKLSLVFFFGSIAISFIFWKLFSFWIVGFLASIAGCIILAFILKLVKIKELFQLFTSRGQE